MTQIIRIGEPDGPYAAFANGAPYAVRLDDLTWPTAEHYIQARKFRNFREAEMIRLMPTAGEAVALAQSMAHKMLQGWERSLPQVAYEALWAKFYQHLDLEDKLLATEEAYLVGSLGCDCYWGAATGFGANVLGKTLMRVRTNLRTRQVDIFDEAV